jgi:hypothetical protein
LKPPASLTLPAQEGDTATMKIALIRRNAWWWRDPCKERVLVA